LNIAQKAADNIHALSMLLPELVLVGLLLLVLITSFFQKPIYASGWLIPTIITALVALAVWFVWQAHHAIFYESAYISISRQTQAVKALLMLIGAVSVIQLSIDPQTFDPRHWVVLFISLLANLIGLCVWISTMHVILFVVALELVSLSAYILVGILSGTDEQVVSLKYLVFGAFSLGLLLFGYSLLFPFFSGTLQMNAFNANFEQIPEFDANFIVQIGLALFFAGIFFKAAIFPLHIWAPMVYMHIRPAMLSYLSIAPKIAALVVLFRLAEIFTPICTEILAGACIGSILLASAAALKEENLKKLFAYSSIAHAGFMLVNVIQPTAQSFQYLFLYMVGYWMMNTGFTTYLQMAGDAVVKMNDFSGLAKRNPKSSLFFTWIIVAMIGLPPTGGFTVKFFTFLGLWGKTDVMDIRLIYILLFAGLGAILLSFFFYFKIPYRIYFKKLSYDSPPVFKAPLHLFFIIISAILLLFLFILPFDILQLFNLYYP
jgi:NADH-quinone oxidoreductase subunit N